MPKVAQIKAIDGEIWCNISSALTPDSLGEVTLWTPDEIKHHNRQLLVAFVLSLVEKYLDAKVEQPPVDESR